MWAVDERVGWVRFGGERGQYICGLSREQVGVDMGMLEEETCSHLRQQYGVMLCASHL